MSGLVRVRAPHGWPTSSRPSSGQRIGHNPEKPPCGELVRSSHTSSFGLYVPRHLYYSQRREERARA
jgi:hypothetical protein